MPTNKKQALQDGIRNALANFGTYSFKISPSYITPTGISDIFIYGDMKYFPSDKVDESNIEDCEYGTFNATFRITYKSDEIEISCPCAVNNCTFSVEKYDGNVFTIKISHVCANKY